MKRKTASQRYSQAGVSLVELMVGLTIGLIITAAAFTALFSNQKLILDKDIMDRSQENFRFASTTITRLVRQATSFGFPTNNNELIVYFDSTQRDCLGESNHSSVNTFKLNTDNELLCELVLNDGTTQTVTLAKNIPGLKFAYGIQNGTGTTPLAYQPYLDSSGAINSTVDVVWGTITSVLTQMSINDGSAKQPTIDFVATSHLRAMTQLASTGGTSLVNPPSGTGTGGTTGGTTDGTTDGTGTQTQCSNIMLEKLDVSGTGFSTAKWDDAISGLITATGQSVLVTVADGVTTTGWQIQKDSLGFNALQSTNSFMLPSGNQKTMSLTVKCGENTPSTIHFVTPQCHNTATMLGQITVKPNSHTQQTWKDINTINAKQKKDVVVTVAPDADTTGWTIVQNGSNPVGLTTGPTSFIAPDTGQPMSLTLKCGANFSNMINFSVVNN